MLIYCRLLNEVLKAKFKTSLSVSNELTYSTLSSSPSFITNTVSEQQVLVTLFAWGD